MEIEIQQLGRDLGIGAVIGAIIGFTAKKMAKLIAVIIGIEIVLFRLLESRGVIQVDWDKITKKEGLKIQRDIDRLQKSIGGVTEMGGLPDALFIIS